MSAINQQSMAQIAHPVFMMSQFVDISKLGLNGRIKKFGYSFICRKDYSHPIRGGIAYCLQSDIMFFETNDRSARFGYDSAMLKSNYAMLTLVDLHTFSGIFDALADYQQVRTGMPPHSYHVCLIAKKVSPCLGQCLKLNGTIMDTLAFG